ncbi:Alpha-amylase precursor [Posidoniimonas corsicana]|uniref:Alpha-amylase n=1 Tax=Posidoniimonas corsicana TaxID=1938618 RepID=A0A5C5V073_9BACT|nr:hypothetical protein [Posidoniimonas corsicana]TWT31300.1 Alpha-amylase precursor [Posidoniimonas corsicana]
MNRLRLTLLTALLLAPTAAAVGQDVSSEPILQIFDARWDTIEDRMADIFVAGYGRLWLPPPARADTGAGSVGYDVFDRFDLGQPRNETAYGTETGLKTVVDAAHTAGVRVHTDFIANHNGFTDANSVDGVGTSFGQAGGYPGFVLSLPGVPDGDFHSAQLTGEETFRLSGLIDIDQSTNHQFIRHPVEPGNPLNIPSAGTTGAFGRPPANLPDPGNARFYPDQDLGGTTVFDPRTNQSVTLHDFNTDAPLAGDAVTDNATGLLMRNLRWMIQEIGVDGFRYDASRHYPRWVLDYLDQAAFLAKQQPLLDGSPDHVFTFIETGGDNRYDFLQGFIRKDIDDSNLGVVGGNRDALDFNLFFSLRDNLSGNGIANDWRNVKNRSIDIHDDGLANNGSQGVAFAQSHDDGPAYLNNVAHAYLSLRPGEWNVYLNADEFDDPLRGFPKPGREDALGGLYGDAVTTLVGIRSSHGRGAYVDRTPAADEKELLIYERQASALVVLNNRLDGGFDARTVQTSFAPGTPLVELTGNAASSEVDPNSDLPEVLIVKANGTVDLRAPRNRSSAGVEHGNGYLIYGVATPEGRLRLTDAAGDDFSSVLPGATPEPGAGGPSANYLNGVTRLADITVVDQESFKLRVETDPVTLPGGIRDRHADGDFAQFRIDDGRDKSGAVIADVVTPGDVAYGFSNFTDTSSPGFFNASGAGVYEQMIDARQLAEGRHYLTGRVYRHRDPGSFTDGDPSLAGDGGPAVFEEFRRVIYVDLLPPESEVVSFAPFASSPENPNDRDLIVRSVDKTADNMHVLLDLPASLTDDQVLAMIGPGTATSYYDRDEWIRGYFGVPSGAHAVTIVTFEPTGNRSVQRFAGLVTDTDVGRGFGDLDHDNVYERADFDGPGGFEEVLYSQNAQFNPAADVTADGLVDNRDLFALVDELAAPGGPSPAVLLGLDGVLRRRGDLDNDGLTDGDDLRSLYAGFGPATWLTDLNVDGVTDLADAAVFVTELVRTAPGDYNLDGFVDAADYSVWRDALASGDPVADGNFDGEVTGADYQVWRDAFGFQRRFLSPLSAASSAAPEPAASALLLSILLCGVSRRRPNR